MKREEVFEVREPPPHGLTRLRARLEERRASRVLRPVLVLAVVAALVMLVVWPRSAPRERVDFSASVAALDAMPAGATVMALGETGVEPMRSTNANVVLVRAFAAERPDQSP